MTAKAHACAAGAVLLLAALWGCALFEPPLPLDQAVARWVPNDPSGPSADQLIGDQEIILSVQAWIKGQPVPRSGGRTLGDADVRRLVALWANRTPVV